MSNDTLLCTALIYSTFLPPVYHVTAQIGAACTAVDHELHYHVFLCTDTETQFSLKFSCRSFDWFCFEA